MKLIHLSDLHLGKRVNEFSMLEDQDDILQKIIGVIDEEEPDGVMIAGDIYDKSVPSAEAVRLFDDFLVRLSKRDLKVFIISGNHDSPERLAFGSRLLNRSGVYLSPVYDGCIEPISLTDAYGQVDLFMLPFVKPLHIKRFFPEDACDSYSEALRAAIGHMNVDLQHRSVLITHQFVTGASRCESEDVSVGGSDNVDVSVFAPFDYVALGHIHSPQSVGRETVRYCGTPLKYSFSEVNHKKSVTVAELGPKGETAIRTVPLVPRRDLCEIRGSYMELTAKAFYACRNTENYMKVTLTDEQDVFDAIGRLRTIYPNIMRLEYDNKRTGSNAALSATDCVERKTPLELLREFYEKQNNAEMSAEQEAFASKLIESIWEGEQ